MSEYFSHIPLAERIRPKTLDEFFGQEHLTGEGKPIRKMLETGNVVSFILWGPPGTGKTTLAKIIANSVNAEFYSLNAVSSGVKDVREIIKRGKANLDYFKKTILFIDEIHRFNKAQQDALLSSVEAGELILIGATTENPSFEVIPALRSRLKIYTLNSLDRDALNKILDYALERDEFLKSKNIVEIDRDFLFYVSGGDARQMLNALESAALFFGGEEEIAITKEVIEEVIQNKISLYDKNGEEHYNLISAFIKSVRGSDPDAALYWLARMLEGGEDPLFIARRLIVLAAEDIGNASPNGLVLAEAAFSAVEKIGMPEARIILAQCATYLAAAPKSNAAYKGIDAAIEFVKNNKDYAVPLHLRNAPTALMKKENYGKGYKYPHSYEGNFVKQNYLPEEISDKQFYFPTPNGQEKNMLERLKFHWKGKKKY
jgi:putative ATPase